jgi:hypothetical protein
MTTVIDQLLTEWRATAGTDRLFSASRVQALLFELWGETEGPAKELVQEWLSVTLHRELFGADELDDLFGRLELLVPTG